MSAIVRTAAVVTSFQGPPLLMSDSRSSRPPMETIARCVSGCPSHRMASRLQAHRLASASGPLVSSMVQGSTPPSRRRAAAASPEQDVRMKRARLAATLAGDLTSTPRTILRSSWTPPPCRIVFTLGSLWCARLLTAHVALVTSASSVSKLRASSWSSACVPPALRTCSFTLGWFLDSTFITSATSAITTESFPTDSNRTSTGMTPISQASS
mmetsp:Transcript_34814/g.98702  ORF Transcript_34814/g.98702 Transcript_34814/m.98702 type:complete len:212 (+) Transcript_34814:529-1164(+)